MPIRQNMLRAAADRFSQTVVTKSLRDAKLLGQQTAFLSHSHKDDVLAMGLQVLLKHYGWNVYIDWQDTSMPEIPNRETAVKIQSKIRESDWFLFLATSNSTSSKWCPWEIGYADTTKTLERILIIPTEDYLGNCFGSEYLELYRRITVDSEEGLSVFSAGKKNDGLRVKYL